MRRLRHALAATVSAVCVLAALTADADPQVWPFDFDAGLAADPSSVQALETADSVGLPGLPTRV